jgi:hypothetical protein
MAIYLLGYSSKQNTQNTQRSQRFAIWQKMVSLTSQSSLYTLPQDGICNDETEFVRALNVMVVVQNPKILRARLPKLLTEAVSPKGDVKWYAELMLFGLWLMVDGQPHKKFRPGKQPTPEIILRCVASAAAELFKRDRYLNAIQKGRIPNTPLSAQKMRKADSVVVTRTDIVKQWDRMFSEVMTVSDAKSRIKSAQNALEDYLHFLKISQNDSSLPIARKSKHLERVLVSLGEATVTNKMAA